MSRMKVQLAYWHRQLHALGLVVWTQGNISVRSVRNGLIYIKASGGFCENLYEHGIVWVEMDGMYDAREPRPSTDTASHLYIHNHLSGVMSVVHTHSTFATAFACAGRDVPCCLTGMADEFGGHIPCAPYAEIGGEGIGEVVVDALGKSRAGAVLVQNHGLFAVGGSVEEAVKRAVMAEDCAKTIYHAMALGPVMLTDKQIEDNYIRYHTKYGQPRQGEGS